MRRTALSLIALAILAITFAWPALGSEGIESQEVAVTPEAQDTSTAPENATEPPEMLCGETEAAGAVLDDILISIDTLFPTTTSWNCNGCIEPSPCNSHTDCGFPQGRCIQNTCYCICDPYVG